LIDIHLHTTHSADSTAKPSELIGKAREAGLAGICFTDHWDVGYDSINEEKIVPYDYARCDLRDLRSDSGFLVYCGIELSPMDHVLDRVRCEMSDASFDCVILAAHYVEKVPQVRYDGFFLDRPKKDAYGRYLSTLISLIRLYGDFDVLGHFDYISRYCPYEDTLMRYADHADSFDELFALLIENDKALEVNTGKHIYRGAGLPIDGDILRRYRSLGGELICLGSDAHDRNGAGYMFAEYRGVLLDCGFSATVHYAGRKPVFTRL
jgi:histidinol-phosphatase (PHP family)